MSIRNSSIIIAGVCLVVGSASHADGTQIITVSGSGGGLSVATVPAGAAGSGGNAVSWPISADFTSYTTRPAFDAECDNQFVDDFSNPAYLHGDVSDSDTLDIWTSFGISAVEGETVYASTFFSVPDWNFIVSNNDDPRYCAGCNGSFELDFTSTSYGDANGVICAAFDFQSDMPDTYATVTFGDGTTEDFSLPVGMENFFGIRSDNRIASIHVGGPQGASTNDMFLIADDVTIADPNTGPDCDQNGDGAFTWADVLTYGRSCECGLSDVIDFVRQCRM